MRYNIVFLTDLVNYCEKRNIDFSNLTYTEQMSVIRNMLVGINKHFNTHCADKEKVYEK